MAGDNPPKIVIGGDKDLCRHFIGQAKSAMRILDNQMRLGKKLQQGVLYRVLDEARGVVVKCTSCFGLKTVEIYAPVTKSVREAVVSEYYHNILLIVYGDPEERINFINLIEDRTFTEETVTCTDTGSGEIVAVKGNSIYGEFILCWMDAHIFGSTSGAEGLVVGCLEEHYRRLYQAIEIFNDDTAEYEKEQEFYSPVDQSPCGDIDCSATNFCTYEWSKTLDHLVVTAFIHYPAGVAGFDSAKWSVAAAFKNQTVSWTPVDYGFWPQSGYNRKACITTSCDDAEDFTDTFIGFDLWTTGSLSEGDIEYWVGMVSDQEATLTIWKLVENRMVQQQEISLTGREEIWADEDAISEGWSLRHGRIVGYCYNAVDDTHDVYWCAIGYEGSYYIEHAGEDDIDEVDESDPDSDITYINGILWNPITREPYVLKEGTGADLEITEQWELDYDEKYIFRHHAAGVSLYYDFNGDYIYDIGGSDWWIGYYPEHEHIEITMHDHPFTFTYLGDSEELDTRCTENEFYPASFSQTLQYEGTLKVWTEWRYQGLFTLHNSSLDLGEIKSFWNYLFHLEQYFFEEPDCTTFDWDQTLTARDASCEGINAWDAKFKKWIFTRNSLAYSYSKVPIESYIKCDQIGYYGSEDPLKPWIHVSCMQEYDEDWFDENCEFSEFCWDCDETYPDAAFAWQDVSQGDSDILECASASFPYDEGWTAVLLSGNARRDDETIKTVEKTGFVIYRKPDDTLFAVDDNGNKITIGEYERAYFQQLILKEEA